MLKVYQSFPKKANKILSYLFEANALASSSPPFGHKKAPDCKVLLLLSLKIFTQILQNTIVSSLKIAKV